MNKVLKNPKAAKGVIQDYQSSIHLSKRSDEAGLVEIWPLENPEETEDAGPAEVETPAEEAPVEEEKKAEPLSMDDDMGLPEGFEMPDLSDLDDLMKEAGL